MTSLLDWEWQGSKTTCDTRNITAAIWGEIQSATPTVLSKMFSSKCLQSLAVGTVVILERGNSVQVSRICKAFGKQAFITDITINKTVPAFKEL